MVDLSVGPSPKKRPDPNTLQGVYLLQTRRKRLYSTILLVFFVALMTAGFQTAQDRNAGDFLDGLHRLDDFPREVFSEAWRNRANLPGLFAKFLPSLIETLNIAAAATLLGVLFGGPLAILSTHGLARWPRLAPLFRKIADILRAVPEIVIALVLIFILGSGPVPAVIAIGLHTVGALAKLYSETAENADMRPLEGLASTGANWSQQIWLGILPQVAPNWLSYALMRFEINVRASAILGFVGSGGIGYDLKLAMQWGGGKYDQVVAIFLLLFLAIVAIDQASSYARNRLVKGH
ncbi:MAG: phosphonate ABC transporter, permease protein PhnE [Cypionkella sp.]